MKNANVNDSFFSLWFKTTLTWILIFTSFIPISLYVTLEMVKVG
jgi:magnesium-transporting ATPase (P-type)